MKLTAPEILLGGVKPDLVKIQAAEGNYPAFRSLYEHEEIQNGIRKAASDYRAQVAWNIVRGVLASCAQLVGAIPLLLIIVILVVCKFILRMDVSIDWMENRRLFKLRRFVKWLENHSTIRINNGWSRRRRDEAISLWHKRDALRIGITGVLKRLNVGLTVSYEPEEFRTTLSSMLLEDCERKLRNEGSRRNYPGLRVEQGPDEGKKVHALAHLFVETCRIALPCNGMCNSVVDQTLNYHYEEAHAVIQRLSRENSPDLMVPPELALAA